MYRNSQILISAVEKYINDLQYIAKENKKSVNNMMNFLIINYIMYWTYQLGQDPKIFKELFKTGEQLITKDSNLSHYIKDTYFKWGEKTSDLNDDLEGYFNSGKNKKYTHVNIPQGYQASGLIFDNKNCITIK